MTNEERDSITVVIPAYNEERTIAGIVNQSQEYAREVIVVDDGSVDRTAESANSAGANVIRIPKNKGKGNALAIGLTTAALNGCSIVVCLDADGQHNPEDIPRMVHPIAENRADMVIGSRFLNETSRNMIPTYRRIGQNLLTVATNFGSSVKITDSQSGYRAFRKEIINKFHYSESGMGIESEMIISASKQGFRIEEIPIDVKYYGLETSTLKPGNHGVTVLGSILRSVRSEHPLLCFGVGGLILIIMGILLGLYSVLYYLRFSALPFGPTLIAVTMITIGIMSAFVGLILNAISIRAGIDREWNNP